MTKQSKIISVLQKAGKTGASITDLSKKIRLSPAKVHQAIHRLRNRDYTISQSNSTYFLDSESDQKKSSPPKERLSRNTKGKIYTTVWTSTLKTDLSVLKDLVENLNKTCRLQLEIVELSNPKQIEVRRYTR